MPVSFRKNLRFTAKPEAKLDEFAFDGGLNTDLHETKLDSNQTPNLSNVLFNNNRSIKTRNGYLRYNPTPIGVTSDTTNSGASSGTLPITTTTTWVAQTFIPSGTINTIQVDLSLAMNTASQEQLCRVELWSTSAGAPSAILTSIAKSQIVKVSTTSQVTYKFIIRTPIALTTAVTYAIVLKPFVPGNGTTVNQVNVYHRGATYANGSVYTYSGTWSADTAKDLIFTVYSGGDTGCTGLLRYYGPGGTQQLLGKFGATLYRGTDATGATTAITLGSGVSLASSNFLDYTVVNDTLLLVDGDNKIQKYRGSTNASYTTGTISVTNGQDLVTGSSTVWGTATNAEVGEYIQLPDTKWYKIKSISSDTLLQIEINYEGITATGSAYTISPWGQVNGALSTTAAASILIAPRPSFIENHINRIWTLEENTLRCSVLDTSVGEEHFNDWDTANNAVTIIVPSVKGDVCTGLYSLNNTLYVFQRRAIWRVYGTSPANFELRNVTNEIGLIDKRTLVEWNDLLIFLSDKGVILFDGSNIKNISDNRIGQQIATWADKDSPAGVLWDNHYIISYKAQADVFNSEALIYDFVRDEWSRATGTFAGAWCAWNGGTDDGQIYFGSSNQGSIYHWNVAGNDDGYEIEMLYDTPSIGFKASVNEKTLKRFYLQQLAQGDYSMTVSLFLNLSTTADQTSTIDLSTSSESLWDTMQWTSGSWSSEGGIITTRVAEFQGLAKFFKFRFSHTGYNEEVEILGMTTTARTKRMV